MKNSIFSQYKQIGIDVTPILAGVGVIGLAIGFGAQTLVKDIITGVFILLENSLSVGDVVSVGGSSGVVETISIRSIRLRDLRGNVHTIPYSEATTVTNMTKEYSYYLIEAGIAYRENYDTVVDIMRKVGEDLQRDPDIGSNILEPIEILGLDRFEDSAVIVRARLKTAPLKQWSVGREYNRRIKAAFDENGIEIPFPHTTIYFGEDKLGNAPHGQIKMTLANKDTQKTESSPSTMGRDKSHKNTRNIERPSTKPRPLGEDDNGDGGGEGF